MKKFLTALLVTPLLITQLLNYSITPALASGTANSTESGKVYIKTEAGEIIYLDTTTVPAENQATYSFLGSKVQIPETFFTDLGDLINRLLTFVIAISALLVFLYLIWGGIDWITSGGDKAKTEAARQKIIAAVIGLIIVAASYAILTIAINFLGAESLQDLIDQAITSEYQVVK